jgi:hypothetical protein
MAPGKRLSTLDEISYDEAMRALGKSVGAVSTVTVSRWSHETPLSEIDALLPRRLPPLVDRSLLLQKVAAHRAGQHVALSVAELRALERARLNQMTGFSTGERLFAPGPAADTENPTLLPVKFKGMEAHAFPLSGTGRRGEAKYDQSSVTTLVHACIEDEKSPSGFIAVCRKVAGKNILSDLSGEGHDDRGPIEVTCQVCVARMLKPAPARRKP